jgi:hypothetical protein
MVIPNYIHNSDLESLVDKLSFDFSTRVDTRAKYKDIFNLIFHANIIDKSLNNEYGFAEINHAIFEKITKRNYRKILIHMYDNNLIFTNVSIHKKGCGKNFELNQPINRAFKIDRTIQHNYDLKSGKLLPHIKQ